MLLQIHFTLLICTRNITMLEMTFDWQQWQQYFSFLTLLPLKPVVALPLPLTYPLSVVLSQTLYCLWFSNLVWIFSYTTKDVSSKLLSSLSFISFQSYPSEWSLAKQNLTTLVIGFDLSVAHVMTQEARYQWICIIDQANTLVF